MSYSLDVMFPPLPYSPPSNRIVRIYTIVNYTGVSSNKLVTSTPSAADDWLAIAIGDFTSHPDDLDNCIYNSGIGFGDGSHCGGERPPAGHVMISNVPAGATVTLGLWNASGPSSASGAFNWAFFDPPSTSSSSSKSSSSKSSSSSSSQSSSSSSSASSSSSSSFSSSSSSSDDYNTRGLYSAIINQGNNDIVPFSWIAEAGVAEDLGNDSILNFTIEASDSPYFDYSAIINRDNSALTANTASSSTIYVPNSDVVQYKHEKSFYVDVIAKDVSGIKEIRTHVGPEKYNFEKTEDAGQVFRIPKFTWE